MALRTALRSSGWLRRPRSGRAPTYLLVLLLCSLLAGAAVMFLQTLAAERAVRDQVALTTRVLTLLRASLRAGLNAETGQRGYVLTQDPSYLEPYQLGAREWPKLIDQLDAALQGIATPTQAQAVERMRVLAGDKLSEIEMTLELIREGRQDKALAVIETDIGEGLMGTFRDLVASLEAEEQAILNAALARAETIEARTLPLFVLFAGATIVLVVVGFWLERRTARAEAEARDVEALRRAHERSDLLARELNHRVKNLFAVILSIVTLSGRGETDVTKALQKVRERIYALSVAHGLSQGQFEGETVSLGEVVQAIIKPHDPDGAAVSAAGPEVSLPVKSVTPVGLVMHELATNAVKYGALSNDGGRVSVAWEVAAGEAGPEVRLEWRERDGPAVAAPSESGFGSVMIRQAATQLGGSMSYDWTSAGLDARLVFPMPS